MSEPDELEERAKSLGMNLDRLREVLKAGFSEPSYDLMPRTSARDNPNRNLCNPHGTGIWYVKYTQNGVRINKRLCSDLEKSREMRDKFFIEINYYKDDSRV